MGAMSQIDAELRQYSDMGIRLREYDDLTMAEIEHSKDANKLLEDKLENIKTIMLSAVADIDYLIINIDKVIDEQ